jgi:hypothetical protein
MRKKLAVFLITCLTCSFLIGCDEYKNEHDTVILHNKRPNAFDNITIEVKDGYFYDSHEKYIIDDNTISLVIYFSGEDDSWG